MKLSPAPVPVRISSPAVARSAAPTRANFGLEPAGPRAGWRQSVFKPRAAASLWPSREPAEPLPSRRQAVAFVRAELPVPDHSGHGRGESRSSERTTAHGLEAGTPSSERPAQRWPFPAARLPTTACDPKEPSLRLVPAESRGESLADLLNALKVSAEELDRAGIQRHSGHLRRTTRGVPAGGSGGNRHGARASRRAMDALAETEVLDHSAGSRDAHGCIAGPQAPTLAGPSLPPQLLNFDHQNSSLRPNRRRTSSWPISLLLATIAHIGRR